MKGITLSGGGRRPAALRSGSRKTVKRPAHPPPPIALPKDGPMLARGQVWRTKEAVIHIDTVGKQIVNYRVLKGEAKRAPVSMSAIEDFKSFLRRTRAELM